MRFFFFGNIIIYFYLFSIGGVRGNFPDQKITEKEIIDSVKNWLRHGKARALNEAR
jgi:hypothetical protein